MKRRLLVCNSVHHTGLCPDLVPADSMKAAGMSLPEDHADLVSVGHLQPDIVLVPQTLHINGAGSVPPSTIIPGR